MQMLVHCTCSIHGYLVVKTYMFHFHVSLLYTTTARITGINCCLCRKEPFASNFWNTKAENWNGRAAMMGFTALIVTEALTGKSIPQFYFHM